jgi:hypothetical protein
MKMLEAFVVFSQNTDDHGRKISGRKQSTDVDKYSFVNRTIENCNRLHASVLASFPCKLNAFRKKIRKQYKQRSIKWRLIGSK